jgi:hypothetical protein
MPDLLDFLLKMPVHVAAFLLGAIIHKSVELGVLEMILVAFLCGKVLDIL